MLFAMFGFKITYQKTFWMSHLPPLATLHELLRTLNIKACGQLSQNFLLQPNSIKNFIKSAGCLKDSYVLEVGPGPGGITRSILEQYPYHVAVVEIDTRFLHSLGQLKLAADGVNAKMDIYNQDILKFNYHNVFPDLSQTIHSDQAWDAKDIGKVESKNRKAHLIGNLPFNISTILLGQWLHDISERRGLWKFARVPLTLSFQEEIGNRMRAPSCERDRSRFSILCQSLCEVKLKRIIPGTAFLPKAKVNCSVIHLVPRPEPLIPVPYPYLNKLVKAVFQFKTKNVLSALESLFPPDQCKLVIEMFSETSINPSTSPIALSMEDFRMLSTKYHEICKQIPAIFNYDFRSRKNDIFYRERKKMQRIVLDGNTLTPDFVKESIGQVDFSA